MPVRSLHLANTDFDSNSTLKMSSGSQQPFKDCQAYNKANSTYVSFPSQADAMIASLQLFHDVPCRIMDLIVSVITHPDFGATQVTLRDSTDVIDIVEESRLKDRMAVVQERSLGEDGCTVQAGFPQFVLDEVLDIFNAHRIYRIKSTFKSIWDMRSVYTSSNIEEHELLKEMSLVHRSWTIPSQKALGRVLFINKPAFESRVLLSPTSVRKSILGPWTTVAAFQMYCCIDEEREEYGYDFLDDFQDEYRQWFENLHRILVGFTNLRSVWIQSYSSIFTNWANFTIGELVRRNTHLRDVTLHAQQYKEPFILDFLAESSMNLKHLNSLDIGGARFSETSRGRPKQGMDLVHLNSLTIECAVSSLEIDLETLRILSTLSKHCLESLHILYGGVQDPNLEEITARVFPPTQCALAFNQLCSLHISVPDAAGHWLKWIGPYSSNLKTVTLDMNLHELCAGALSLVPPTIRNLNVRFTEITWTTIDSVAFFMKCIMDVFSSGHFSGLASFSLLASGRHLNESEFEKESKQEAQILRNRILEFEESMKCFFQSAGIESTLDI